MIRRRIFLGDNKPYTEIAYLKSTGTQYIDTGYKPNQNTRIVCEMKTDESTPYGRFFGCVNGTSYNSTPHLCLDYESYYNGTLHVMWGTNGGWVTISSVVGDYDKHKYEIDKGAIYRDDTLVYTYTTETWQSPINLAIFNYMKSNGINTDANEVFRGRVYSFQIYDDDVLVRDFVPVEVEGVGYLYDKVTKQLFGNQGSGTFICGPEKGSYNKVLMTSTTNPEVLAICYAQGWCADASYMTYGEAREVTSVGTVFRSSNIVHFDEFKEFGVTSLQGEAFRYCDDLESIKLPTTFVSINGNDAFRCQNLRSIEFSNFVTGLGSYTFTDDSLLEAVTIPPLVTSIGSACFQNCTSSIITLHENIEGLGAGCFSKCSFADTTVYLSKLVYLDWTTISCTNVEELYIGAGITNFPSATCQDCFNLEKVTLMGNITNINNGAFGNCRNLTEIIINAKTAPTTNAYSINEVGNNGTLRVPIGATGYDSGDWAYLVNNKGWTIVYQDIWPRKYSYATNQWTEFTRVEYLECDGNQWIDLGFAPRSGMKFSIDTMLSSNGYTHMLFYSTINWSTNDELYFAVSTYWNSIQGLKFAKSSAEGATGDFRDVRHTYSVDKYGIYVDNTQVSTVNNPTDFESDYSNTLRMLAAPDNYFTYGKVYEIKIEENGSTIMDLVPGRFGNSVGCMYDKISGKLFYSNGSQPFACGPDLT